MRRGLLPLGLALALMAPGLVLADTWKDESGRGRGEDPWRKEWSEGKEGRRDDHRDGYRAHVPLPYLASPPPLVPPGHMPPPGECRLWFPGVPPGQQPPPERC